MRSSLSGQDEKMRRAIPYAEFIALARRHARRSDEAEDIVQEVLIAAVQAGRDDFTKFADRRWMAGAIRKRAAFDARSAARRREREARWQLERSGGQSQAEGEALGAILADLPKSLRVVAALALSGHSRAEIAYLLDLSDAALRQRVRALKLALGKKGVAMPAEMVGLNLDLAYGAIRQALAPALKRHGVAFATHDPDGHIFLFKRSRKV
ncbi:transcriptional regulator [Pelagibacterium sp. 26DY04]|uniref:RNA polymerase sigma factor n=1 Tax=Pelagibacterium sp. 26DY04 TaxID=2967130 RepID=UPI0028153622|nr:transcriptional regulator [Pelagibacterium sp. 26DY04]WMT86925.1 transcriptional regulator [Pelagibacterium sp. 26DY04]